MSVSKVWQGNPTFTVGQSTPFGIYDASVKFQQDAPKVAKWCATRLGFPIVDIELLEENFYACFEEAVSEYSAQINQFNIRNNLGALTGKSTTESFTGRVVNGSSLPNVIAISDSYGTLVGVGGNVDIKKGHIQMLAGQQTYDLQELWGNPSESNQRIDVTKVFYEATPAINRFFDPYSVSGQGTLNLIDEFGFGSFSPAAQFIMMPLYEDLLRIQQIEMNDQIRKSAHTFNIVNNKLQIFPIPEDNKTLWFEYMNHQEYLEGSTEVSPIGSNQISDWSNIGYDFADYSDINDVGIQWIRKYTLALSKELLGAIREKYSSIPIPGSEVSLDGASLRAEAQTEKDQLIEHLRENLEEVSKKTQMAQEAEMSEQQQQILSNVPLAIYIG